MDTTRNETSRRKKSRFAGGTVIVLIVLLIGVVIWQMTKSGSEPAEASTFVDSTTTTVESNYPSTTLQETVDPVTLTTTVNPGQAHDELVALSGSFQAEPPPTIPPPESISALPAIKANTAQIVLKSSRLIDESGSIEELTVTYDVDYLGTITDDSELPVQFTFDPSVYKMWVYLPALRIEVVPKPKASFEWDGQTDSYPVHIVEVLSDGTIGEPKALPNDAAVAFKAEGSYYFSQPMQKLLFGAAASSKECVSVARDAMRNRFMEAIYSGYEEIGFARELIDAVPVIENIMVPDFNAQGVATEMLTLGGGVWDEFELVSVTCVDG